MADSPSSSVSSSPSHSPSSSVSHSPSHSASSSTSASPSPAPRDENFVPTLLAALNTDGVTPKEVAVNPTTHALKVDDDTTGSDNGVPNAVRDGNFVPVLMAVSSDDGVTPVEVYADSSGNLLIDSN